MVVWWCGAVLVVFYVYNAWVNIIIIEEIFFRSPMNVTHRKTGKERARVVKFATYISRFFFYIYINLYTESIFLGTAIKTICMQKKIIKNVLC